MSFERVSYDEYSFQIQFFISHGLILNTKVYVFPKTRHTDKQKRCPEFQYDTTLIQKDEQTKEVPSIPIRRHKNYPDRRTNNFAILTGMRGAVTLTRPSGLRIVDVRWYSVIPLPCGHIIEHTVKRLVIQLPCNNERQVR